MTARKKRKYASDLPGRMYGFFKSYSDPQGAPSFAKFAMLQGLTVADLEDFRKHERFDRAYRECMEIRRDYIIDRALTRRFDASVTRMLLDLEAPTDEGSEIKIRFEMENERS